MKILICLSNVPDTTTKAKLTENKELINFTDVQWVINPWDELALTRVIELRELNKPIEQIAVACVADSTADQSLHKALAMGADVAFRVNFKPIDSFQTAKQLSKIVLENSFDIVVCGLESSDYNNSAVGEMLAEICNLSSIAAVSSLYIENECVILTQETELGFRKVKAKTPFLAVVQKGIAIAPILPSMRGIISARKKKIINVEPIAVENYTKHITFSLPLQKSKCQYFNINNIDELINVLHIETNQI